MDEIREERLQCPECGERQFEGPATFEPNAQLACAACGHHFTPEETIGPRVVHEGLEEAKRRADELIRKTLPGAKIAGVGRTPKSTPDRPTPHRSGFLRVAHLSPGQSWPTPICNRYLVPLAVCFRSIFDTLGLVRRTAIPEATALHALRTRCSQTWEHIEACREDSATERANIEEILASKRLVPPDTALVIFGSLARDEWSGGSDVDWTLLVDGEARQEHLSVSQDISLALKEAKYREPGPGGVFGGVCFSHELIHQIGGDADSNRNTTRRILLLIESTVVGPNEDVRERVIRQVLKRYVEDDYEYRISERKPYIPRFFLNDVVRYWRMMAVDFAAKRRDRSGDKWAIRNFKLRMSRKLLFVAGLCMALSCRLRPSAVLQQEFDSDEQFCSAMIDHLNDLIAKTPIEILAQLCLDFDADEAANDIFSSYDAFLGVLRGSDSRDRLEELIQAEEALSDPTFKRARQIARDYQRGLTKLFFKTDQTDGGLTDMAQRYGVF